jgi:hypothetical protein
MARKRTATGNGKSADSLPVAVAIDVPEGTPSYYSNWIEVSNTKWDFCLTAALMPSRHNKAKIAEMQANRALTLTAEVQLIIPTTLLPGLIRALTMQKERFEKETKTELKEVEQ